MEWYQVNGNAWRGLLNTIADLSAKNRIIFIGVGQLTIASALV